MTCEMVGVILLFVWNFRAPHHRSLEIVLSHILGLKPNLPRTVSSTPTFSKDLFPERCLPRYMGKIYSMILRPKTEDGDLTPKKGGGRGRKPMPAVFFFSTYLKLYSCSLKDRAVYSHLNSISTKTPNYLPRLKGAQRIGRQPQRKAELDLNGPRREYVWREVKKGLYLHRARGGAAAPRQLRHKPAPYSLWIA